MNWRRFARFSGVLLLTGALLLGTLAPATSQNNRPIRGEAVLSAEGGYARLVIKLEEDVDSEVLLAGSVMVIRFKRPVDVPVDKIADAVPDYVGSARRDPDGSAIRLALQRKVTVNSMTAGERLYVDLMPDGWKGSPPGLPQEVLKELSDRARAAERALRQQRASMAAKARTPIRVRAAVQPTFVRYVFEMPDGVGVNSTLSDQKLSLLFTAPLTFDLADAKLAAPPIISGITQKLDSERSSIDIGLIGNVDVHSFREEKNYIVDIGFQQPEQPRDLPAAISKLINGQAGGQRSVPVPNARPAEPAREIVPPTSDTLSQQIKGEGGAPESKPPAKAETKPELKAETKPELKPIAPVEAKAEPKTEPKVEPKVEAKVEPKPEAKPEAKPEMKAEVTADQPPPAAPSAASELAMAPPSKPETTAPAVTAPAATEPAAAAPESKSAAPAAASAAKPGIAVEIGRSPDGLRLGFPFGSSVPAALFRRADSLWLVFDSNTPIDLDPVRRQGGANIAEIKGVPMPTGQAVQIRMSRPQLASLTGDAQGWAVVFADVQKTPSQPLQLTRDISNPTQASLKVALPGAGAVHRLSDPEAGDTLLVVTAAPPSRGFLKRQDFVEMTLLESQHGVVVQPNSDDLTASIGDGQVMFSRPGGLTLSSASFGGGERSAARGRPIFDPNEWQKYQQGLFFEKLEPLMNSDATATGDGRLQPRMELARFYMARGLYAEAKGLLDLNLAEKSEDPIGLVMRAVCNIMLYRPDEALKDLGNPVIGPNYESQLWRAVAMARKGKWSEAREKLKNFEFVIDSQPLDLQRVALSEAMRAALETKDFAGASAYSSELEHVGIPPELQPTVALYRGRLHEGIGRDMEALDFYQQAVNSTDRSAESEAKLRELTLRQRRGEISPTDMLPELERLALTWRGDSLEIRVQQMMAKMYAELGRYPESLTAAKVATKLQPKSEEARQTQDEAAALFSQVFLTSKGDDLPPIDALAMFYDHRELTPIGRKGDEMIRRLADRLVAVDLLDQAAELLQYQVDRRVEGAARAQVAARLAMIYLMNRKPARAITALHSTRIADLSGELRQQRLLLEARAQSDIGRHDLGLDIISNVPGREAIRLRADIYWASRRWREASEQLELYLGDRWRDFRPLDSTEKSDVIRATIGYSLADDSLGLARFREKYAPLMTGTDKVAFDTASSPATGSNAEFSAIAKMAAGVDTLEGFLREMRARFPEASAKAQPQKPGTDPQATGSLPEIPPIREIKLTR
ncbi:outer membrane biosynthesis protein TonB [Rhodopseudomonas faecalis]|uniref:Outer membrane biosynthesis protein TonB n=1 Tax=Rhodopseudomonas faecalis TaxID=99655 RepID=A0A318T7X8_9BRAD|nr:tetratricopeptide repeat protein [Rhodopseudomonas faecalis]PYF00165.1 outer membrane biosynthesis protein TonB [Rhodopseudomonas faecalis]